MPNATLQSAFKGCKNVQRFVQRSLVRSKELDMVPHPKCLPTQSPWATPRGQGPCVRAGRGGTGCGVRRGCRGVCVLLAPTGLCSWQPRAQGAGGREPPRGGPGSHCGGEHSTRLRFSVGVCVSASAPFFLSICEVMCVKQTVFVSF